MNESVDGAEAFKTLVSTGDARPYLAWLHEMTRCVARMLADLDALRAENAKLRRVAEEATKLRAIHDEWLRLNPQWERPEGAVLPHDPLYVALDALSGTSRETR